MWLAMVKGYPLGPARYQLKHRLLGAAILIGLAVLIIPSLLGKPGFLSSEKKAASSVEVEEEGFRSKIEPLSEDASKPMEEPVKQAAEKPALANRAEAERTTFKPVLEDRPFVTADKAEDARETRLEEKAQEQSDMAGQSVADKLERAPATEKAKIATPKPASSAVAKSKPKSESATTEPDKNQIPSNGWVVRVGTFARKQNAESVTKLLRSKGLDPRQSEVETKVGKATRIWLGPYLEREEANRVSAGLIEVTGEKGYVTRAAS